MTHTHGYGHGHGTGGGSMHAHPGAARTLAGYQTLDPQMQAAYGTTPPRGQALRALAHATGALASLALVIGVSVWGYGQVKRDVAGVPVVEALDGPMRVAPERPGGQIAAHSGLSVNEVKAGAPAAGAPETVRLAPEGVDLTAEDRAAGDLAPRRGAADAPSPAITPTADAQVVDARFAAPDSAADDAAPGDATDAAIAQALAEGIAPDQARASAAGPVARSLRPAPRPSGGADIASRAITATLGPAAMPETSEVPEGTRLVQLGAFDTADEARAAWQVIASRFAPLIEDKARVVQQASAGGDPFWRLRAQGFDDLADARRFCAALVAERTDCIPVLAR